MPQTTRNTVRGIINRTGRTRLPRHARISYLGEEAQPTSPGNSIEAFADADIVLYLVDATRRPGPEEEAIATALVPAAERLVVAINKMDSPEADPKASRVFLSAKFPKAGAFELSALTGSGLGELLAALYARAQEGPAWYPRILYRSGTGLPIVEIIREKIFLYARDELPHAVYVSYEDSSHGPTDSLLARYDLVVEGESQKGILIGKGGSMIKRIREDAEKDLADIFDYEVKLEVSVRVDPDWKKDDKRLEQIIYFKGLTPQLAYGCHVDGEFFDSEKPLGRPSSAGWYRRNEYFSCVLTPCVANSGKNSSSSAKSLSAVLIVLQATLGSSIANIG